MRQKAAAACSLGVLVALALAATTRAQDAVSLPVTAQTTSYYAGDDGDIQAGVVWPSPRFTVVGDGTMTDLLTGLRWTVDANAPGPSACGPGATKRWQEALDYVACLNSNNYLGFHDWRLPNVNELHSLWNYQGGAIVPWLRNQGFTNVEGTSYWSSTTEAFKTEDAWVVKATAAVSSLGKTYRLPVWPVRGTTTAPARVWKTGQTVSYAAGDDGAVQAGATWPSPRFTVSGDCVTDQLTGLEWVKKPDATVRSWQDALTYANDVNLCGFTDWRLPNVTELKSLQNFGVADSASWLNTQGFEDLQLDTHWSSTTFYNRTEWAWVGNLWQSWVYPLLTTLDQRSVDYVNWVKVSRNNVVAVRTAGSPSPFHILTATKAGTGDGVVTSQDGFINCGTTCSKRYGSGAVVTLTATAGSTSTFTGWSGDPDCTDGQITLAGDRRCVATFNLQPPLHTLTASKVGAGSGTVKTSDGLVLCGSTCSAMYSPGVLVALLAIPDLGSEFGGWSGDADCADGLLTMDAARGCVATFVRLPSQLGTRLQRSGQETTYYAEDDGEIRAGLSWPSPRFVVAGDCVKDELTGLTWLRNPDSTFRAWTQALRYASNFATCGFDDWRLPNSNELHSVLSSGAVVETWLGSQGFSMPEGGRFWSSTSAPGGAFNALQLGTGANVEGGDANSMISHVDKRTSKRFAWPVRGTAGGPAVVSQTAQASCYDSVGTVIPCAGTGQDGEVQSGAAWPASRFVIRGDCVTDSLSGLMWARNANLPAGTGDPEDGAMAWAPALDFTGALTLCDHSDWRLPNRNELWSLAHRQTVNTASWLGAQGFVNVQQSAPYWSSTTNPYAWYYAVSFFMDDVTGSNLHTKTFAGTGAAFVWPVRTAIYDLTLTKEGGGSGTVTAGDGRIDCGGDCSEPYLLGTVVNLSAVADGGSTFTGWSGDADCADGQVTVDDDMTCTATFEITGSGSTLTVTSPTGGTVTGTGIACPGDCAQTYTSGTSVVLTASPATGYKLVDWTGCDSPAGTQCTMSMTANKTVAATFALNTPVTVATATGMGIITLATASPGCGFYNVQARTEVQVGTDAGFDYPYGMVEFGLICPDASLTLTYSGATELSGLPYRSHGPTTPGNPATTQWYTFPGASIQANVVTLHLLDGQLGDDTGIDGGIVGTGGPGQAAQQQVPIPTLTEWGMLILSLLLLMAGALALRKRKAA